MSPRARIHIAAVAAGGQALLAQSLLLREDLLLYGGNEVALGAFLALWLLGIAVGALAMARVAVHAERLAVPLLVVQGALPLLALGLARAARTLADIPAYEPFPLTSLLLWTVPIAVPVALTTGALVPALAARARTVGGSVTGVYVAEAMGSLLGGAGTTLLLLAGVAPAAITLGCAVIGLLAAAALAPRRARVALAVAGVVLFVVLQPTARPLEQLLRTQHVRSVLPGATLLDWHDTPSSSLTLAELHLQRVLLIDGHIVAAFPDPERSQRAAGVMAALTGGPRHLLVIGNEAVDLLPGILALGGVQRVVWLVGDAGVRDFSMRHVPGLASERRLETYVGDPMRSIDGLRALGPFDAIWHLVGTPIRRSDDRFVSVETLTLLGSLLTADGVMALPVRSAENYMGPRLRFALGTLVAGLAQAFDAVALVPGDDGVLLGSPDKNGLTLDADALYAAYRRSAPRASGLTAGALAAVVEPRRVEQARSVVEALLRDPTVRPSELRRPLALYGNLLVRAEQESEQLARGIEALRRTAGVLWAPALVLALFALGAVGLRRRRERTQGAAALALLAAGGAVGIGLDLLLLHTYQGRFGTLQFEVGWLFGLWMGGLAAGGLLGRRLTAKRSAVAVGIVALLTLACIGLAFALGADALITQRALFAVAFVFAGAASGVLIPVAEALLAVAGSVGARAGVGIEAADHFGGALGALAFGMLGIPVLGLTQVAWQVVALSGFGLAALLLAWSRWHKHFGHAVENRLARGAVYESFPYRRIIWVLFALSAAAVVGHAVVQRLLVGPRVELEAGELADAGLRPPLRQLDLPVLHYRGEVGGAEVGLASRAVARVQGYGGPLNLLVSTDAQARIRHVRFLEHHETPAYVEMADRLFADIEGKDLLQPIEVRAANSEPAVRQASATAQRVDGITGATVTSRAITTALANCGRSLGPSTFGRAFAGSSQYQPLRQPAVLYLLISLVLALPVFLWAGRWLRRLWLLAHLAIGGLWLGVQLSSVQLLAWLRLEPDLGALSVSALLGLVVLLTAFTGPLYCGTLCPAGAAQELLSHLGLARRLPARLDTPARFIKYVLLALLVIGALGFASDSVLQLDALRQVWADRRSGLGVVLVALITIGALFVPRFGCRYLCPTGALLALIGKLAALRRLWPAKLYGACDLGVRGRADVDCLQCNRCLVGEAAPPASERRLPVVRLALVTALFVLALAVVTTVDNGPARPSVEPEIRPVDAALIRMQTRSGRLSGKRATYWHVVRP